MDFLNDCSFVSFTNCARGNAYILVIADVHSVTSKLSASIYLTDITDVNF